MLLTSLSRVWGGWPQRRAAEQPPKAHFSERPARPGGAACSLLQTDPRAEQRGNNMLGISSALCLLVLQQLNLMEER